MQDAPPPAVPLALAGRTVTPELVDAARRHLVMLRALHEEVRLTVPTLCPPGTGAWRSAAADRYVERLDHLRDRLIGALGCLADASAALDERIRRMQAQLDAQHAAGGTGR
ncbi:hypothetical protein [Agromyces bauzanensis]|uniref:Uncharacterized protein n=1 Tax=Agromyces bauzanensis TaxID=1308924 RepID=A0A917PLW7_9MICO|nr:hypothetical protein [Agromyces bauzanensis]GGJ84407.1 hypothetical protein GCM10011372_23370 [Agromyces bauzanensis]